MGTPVARINDPHLCPAVTPGTPPVPHVGGAIAGPGCPTVLVSSVPVACMGDMTPCAPPAPPNLIQMGSSSVLVGGRPVARMGDPTAHGGKIMMGCPSVIIGG